MERGIDTHIFMLRLLLAASLTTSACALAVRAAPTPAAPRYAAKVRKSAPRQICHGQRSGSKQQRKA
jgi:Spy/CpxP family protein refolding chaperone